MPQMVITSPFGPRVHPVRGGMSMHEGIDIAAAMGSPVKAMGEGRVQSIRAADPGPGRGGWTLVVDHGGGWRTLYLHLSRVAVPLGRALMPGQVIGYSGTAGTGPHLHLEIRGPGGPVDPVLFLQPGSYRYA